MKKPPKIIALVPAYNEEGQIAGVLSPLVKSPLIDKVVVINDGSEDRTAAIAKVFPIHLINHKVNHGKGAALQTGIRFALKNKADIIVFFDADLVGLTPAHIKKLIKPLLSNKKLLMTVGVFIRDFKKNKETTVEFSGQRAMKKEFFTHLIDLTHTGFGVEKILNEHLKKISQERNLPLHQLRKRVKLQNILHVKKETKYGTLEGWGSRIKMGLEISRAPWELNRYEWLKKISEILNIPLESFLAELDKRRLAKKIKKDEKRAILRAKRKNIWSPKTEK